MFFFRRGRTIAVLNAVDNFLNKLGKTINETKKEQGGSFVVVVFVFVLFLGRLGQGCSFSGKGEQQLS